MSFGVKVAFSGREIYDSGTIIVRDLEQPVTIQIRPNIIGSTPYNIRLLFAKGEEQDGSMVSWTMSQDGAFEIRMVNLDSPFGLTPHGPIVIGSYEGKKILLDFVIYTLGVDPLAAPKLLIYTLAGELVDG